MGKLVCMICKKERGVMGELFSLFLWQRCTRHGVICNSCATGFITKDTCPRCGKKLTPIQGA